MFVFWGQTLYKIAILLIACKLACTGPSWNRTHRLVGTHRPRPGGPPRSGLPPPSSNEGGRRSGGGGGPKKYTAMRIMSFNTYVAGGFMVNGFDKIAKHIKLANPDIVGLQEINQANTSNLVERLGKEWTHCSVPQTYWLGSSIVTKHTVIEKYRPADGFSNIGCRIELPSGQRVNVWNVHLNYRNYGPYTTCIRPTVDTLKKLIDQEYHSPDGGKSMSRVDSIVHLLNHQPMLTNRGNTGKEPIILTGDFNVPSGLDWTFATKSRHCGFVFDWPVSKILSDNGFVDSFRKVYPNPLSHPGITWSPINYYYLYDKNFTEPQDRIDFIYYKGSRINAVSSRTYVGTKPVYYVPNSDNNDWPSDHASVITDFDISL